MNLDKQAIKNLDRTTRIKLMNSVSGIKPGNLIGTISKEGKTNVAVFSSIVHLGSDPALLGFIMRPTGDVPRNTYSNIIENEVYTINHIHPNFIKNAHYTSAKFDENISEFERCGLTEEFNTNCKAPFVKESTFKMALRFKEEIPIPINGTSLIIGEIEHIILPEASFNENQLNLENTNSVGISGLNSYYSVKKITDFPYVRLNEFPDF